MHASIHKHNGFLSRAFLVALSLLVAQQAGCVVGGERCAGSHIAHFSLWPQAPGTKTYSLLHSPGSLQEFRRHPEINHVPGICLI